MSRLIKSKEIEKASNENGKSPFSTISPGELRLNKDLKDIKLPTNCAISFPNGREDVMNFDLTITPHEGFYTFVFITIGEALSFFTFNVTNIYPHKSPKVKCVTKVCHPYIDYEGNVFLNILCYDWKPVFTISNVVDGIYHLFTAKFTSNDRCFIDRALADPTNFDSLRINHILLIHYFPCMYIYNNIMRSLCYIRNDDGLATSQKHIGTISKMSNFKLKRMFVYVCDMDNIYRTRRRLFTEE